MGNMKSITPRAAILARSHGVGPRFRAMQVYSSDEEFDVVLAMLGETREQQRLAWSQVRVVVDPALGCGPADVILSSQDAEDGCGMFSALADAHHAPANPRCLGLVDGDAQPHAIRERTELLVEDDVAALRTERSLDGCAELLDAAQQRATGFFIKLKLLSTHEVIFSFSA